MSLEGKVVIVTGGGSGIGRAAARLLAAEQAKIVLAELNDAGGRRVQSEVEAEGAWRASFEPMSPTSSG